MNEEITKKVAKKVIGRIVGIIFFSLGSYFIFNKIISFVKENMPNIDPIWLGLVLLFIGAYITTKYLHE